MSFQAHSGPEGKIDNEISKGFEKILGLYQAVSQSRIESGGGQLLFKLAVVDTGPAAFYDGIYIYFRGGFWKGRKIFSRFCSYRPDHMEFL